ncbi:MAG TPA: hypothetical protein VGX68_07460 [Thermoanaerobaculia bacterium]|jgi:hypothetical protein|nr:hypothetical protein [Thermoanaerobaculia bacterium]
MMNLLQRVEMRPDTGPIVQRLDALLWWPSRKCCSRRCSSERRTHRDHFHVFGSLAFLAFYLDWKVLGGATAVVVVDQMLLSHRMQFYDEASNPIPMEEGLKLLRQTRPEPSH